MTTTINELPDEMLLTIFKYLPAENLSMTVPLVNHRWRALSQAASLWNRLTFTPPITMSDDDVAHALQTMPSLKFFRLQHGDNIDLIVDTLCQNCPDIRHVVMERKRGPSRDKLSKLLTTYRDIECLNVLVSGSVFQIDYARLHGISNLRSVSLFLFVASDSESVRWIEDQFHGARVLHSPSVKDAVQLLSARKDTLQFLSLCSKITSEEMAVVCTCEHLKSLCLQSDSRVTTTLDLDALTRLQNLECLQLCIYHNRDKHKSVRAKPEMPLLVKLEIVSSFSFTNSSILSITHISPNLQYLKLQTVALNDECFATINKCQHLKHIDISFNYLLTDDTVKYIASGCPELEFLDVSSCTAMTERIINILKPLKRIQELRLDHQKLSVRRFRSIPSQLPSVRILSVNHCSQLRPSDLQDFQTKFPTLKLIRYPEYSPPLHHDEEMLLPVSM